MKISDFLRMKITTDNKQFDMIKNVRFLDDRNEILVGKGTTTVQAFCEAFFDYVYRNYSSARGAEKLIKSNRKKYTRFSGSENMLLVQRIFNEIIKEYAITTYSITCEVDNQKVKKPVQASAPVHAKEAALVQPVKPAQVEKKEADTVVHEESKPEQDTVSLQPNGSKGYGPARKAMVQPENTIKIQTLNQELERMNPRMEDVIDDPYVHPMIEKEEVSITPEPENVVQAIDEKEAVTEQEIPVEIPVQSAVKPIEEEQLTDAVSSISEEVKAENVGGITEEPVADRQNNSPDNQPGKDNHKDKKGKKGDKKDFPDARMKPGKGIPPIKNLRSVPKFQAAATGKSKLNIDDIPCIAVIEENKVPTMEEVPFIGIEEDNSVPTMDEVPYVGVDEYGNPLESSGDFLLNEPLAPDTSTESVPLAEAADTILTPVEAVPEKTEPVPAPAVSKAPEIKIEAPAAPVISSVDFSVNKESIPEDRPITFVPPQKEKQEKKKAVRKTLKDIRSIISNAITQNKQVVFTGPSGTGKTYHVRKYVRRMAKGYDGFMFVQFHPSYEYSDFIEGLRPVNIINTTAPTNVRMDGSFKAFCRKIVEDNLEYAIPGFASMYSEKKQKVVQTLYESIRDRKEAIEDGNEVSYFRPDSQEYLFEKGAREYYFVIDELNRADAQKIFGDVIFALDEDYRGIENRFDTRLGNLKSYRIIQADDIGKANYNTTHIGYAEQMKFDCFERGFFIPRNLHIIGTMNEIGGFSDEFGFSFKHKFKWVDIDTEEIMLPLLRELHREKDIFWLDQFAENLNLVNRLISDAFTKHYRIGPAYFKNLDESADSIDLIFDEEIEPLLKEYLKGKPQDLTERFISECRRALRIGI